MTRPSFTCRRSGQREPQLTVQALHTVRSALVLPVPFGTNFLGAAVGLSEQATSAPALAPNADHFKNCLLEGLAMTAPFSFCLVEVELRRQVTHKCGTLPVQISQAAWQGRFRSRFKR